MPAELTPEQKAEHEARLARFFEYYNAKKAAKQPIAYYHNKYKHDPAFVARKLDKSKQWAKENKHRKNEINKRSRERYPSRCKNRQLKRVYGISLDDWNTLFESQGRVCAVCHTGESLKGWHTDHCHRTGIVRGILCYRCNPMLGFAKDNTTTLANAIKYLEKHSGRERREARPELPPDTGADQAPGERLQCTP